MSKQYFQDSSKEMEYKESWESMKTVVLVQLSSLMVFSVGSECVLIGSVSRSVSYYTRFQNERDNSVFLCYKLHLEHFCTASDQKSRSFLKLYFHLTFHITHTCSM